MVIENETDCCFPKKLRLLRTTEFRRVYTQRQSVAKGPLVMYGSHQVYRLNHVRVGISVSRRVGNAVVRNQWKRKLREAFRNAKAEFFEDFDVVIVVRASGTPPTGKKSAQEMTQLLLCLFERLRTKIRHSERA